MTHITGVTDELKSFLRMTNRVCKFFKLQTFQDRPAGLPCVQDAIMKENHCALINILIAVIFFHPVYSAVTHAAVFIVIKAAGDPAGIFLIRNAARRNAHLWGHNLSRLFYMLKTFSSTGEEKCHTGFV